jgi:exonuclease VII small subunit
MEQLQAERARHQEAFQRFTRLWTDCLRRHAALEQDQRVLAEKALALEQYRLECIGRSENSVVAEKQLERLRRRWAALAAAAERRLARDRQAVEAELTSLEERFHRLQQLAADLTRRELEWSDRQTEWERGEAVSREERARLEQALHSTRAQRDAALWQLGRAREEMERMALTLLEESGPTPAMQAA